MSDDDSDFLYSGMRDPASDLAVGVQDIGCDVRIKFFGRHDDTSGVRVGLWESHRSPDGRECAGSIVFDVPEAEGLSGPRWTVESWEPLTVSPSIRCSCGHHGWIRDGRWVPT